LETALRHLSAALCQEIGADGLKLRIAKTERDDAPAYSEIYNAEQRKFLPGSPRDLLDAATEADIAWFSRHTTIHDVSRHESDFVRHLPVIKRLDIKTVLQVPIRLHGAVVGYVRAWTCGRTTNWKSGELMVAASIAQLTALVLERQNRMRIESRLRHANIAAEQASRAKSQFLANMSHEIRTPMNGVFGMTDLLLQTPLSQRQSQIIGTIQQSTTALLTIINDILDLSRIEAGRVELEQKPFHLRGCVEGALALFVEEARRKKLALNLTIDRTCPEWLLGDATRLRQVCVNLLSNALKFTHQGAVSLHVDPIEDNGERASLKFTLRDTGIGIDPNVQQRLFHPFAQADGSITRRFGGTGLGLSISRSLIEMMGGTVALDSAPGAGTTITFTVSLERVKAPAVAESSAASLTAWFAGPDQSGPVVRRRFGGRVLVAEDNPVNQEVTRELVGALGCAVVCVENGEEALVALANEQFDLVLMDCQMPVMDGLTATRQIRSMEASAGRPPIKIVAVTANAFAEDRQACLDAGMDGYLSKPFTGAQLDETLQRWLPSHLVIERRGSTPRPASPTDDVPDFDPIVLEPMKRLRQDFYRRLITTFLLHTPKLIEAIKEAAAHRDRDALRLAAHSLKSSSANVGASRLSALARDTELSASRGTLENAAAKAEQIELAYRVITDVFAKELADIQLPAVATA
jgi:two-component system, sensor histidine kinase